MKIAVIGAGSAQFIHELADLASRSELGPYELALCDTHGARLAAAAKFSERVVAETGADCTVSAHADRRGALEGARFAITSIGVGMQDSIRADFEIPARYGLRQTVADTCGIGAISRILRTAPVMADIGRDTLEAGDNATLLNVTNPMAMICMALDRMVPELPVIGLCHSTWMTAADIATHLGIDIAELSFSGAGVNHQVFISRLEHRGEDVYPRFRAMAHEDTPFARTVRADLMRRLGYYVTESSKHNSEYVPWYLPWDDQVEHYGIGVNPYWERRAQNAELFSICTDYADGRIDLPLAETLPSGEYAPRIISAAVTGEPDDIYVNVPNRGPDGPWVPELQPSGVVEIPATCDGDGVHPRRADPIPPQCAALNRRYLDVCELAVAAVVDGDRDKVFQAAYLDPNASATMSAAAIEAMVTELLAAHQAAGRLPEALCC
jgi:alpha-galactosidase